MICAPKLSLCASPTVAQSATVGNRTTEPFVSINLVLQLRLDKNRDSLPVFDGREFDVSCGLVWISGGLAAGA